MTSPNSLPTDQHPKWRNLVTEQGMLGIVDGELGQPPGAVETETIVAVAALKALNVLAERQNRLNLVKGISGDSKGTAKFLQKKRTAAAAEAGAADDIVVARRLFAVVYAHNEGADGSPTDCDFEIAFGRFVRDFGGRTADSLAHRREEVKRLKGVISAAFTGKGKDQAEEPVSEPLTITKPRKRVIRETSRQDKPGQDDSGYATFRSVKKQMALSRLLKEGRARRNSEYYRDITPELLDEVAPEKLWTSLVGPDVALTNGTTVAMTYRMPLSGRKLAVALSPQENKVLVQAPGHYGARASNGVRLHRPGPLSDADYAAMVRAAQHALDPRLQAMRTYKVHTLERQQSLLERFVESATFPGLQRMGTQVGMIMKFAEVEGIVDSMLDVIGAQREWSARERDLHRRAIDNRLYGAETDNTHFDYAKKLFVMLLNYNKHRQLLFQEKIQGVCEILDQHAERLARQNT